jgi:hypothetical protein
LFLDELLDEKGFDGGSRVAATSLDHRRDISFHRIIGAVTLPIRDPARYRNVPYVF